MSHRAVLRAFMLLMCLLVFSALLPAQQVPDTLFTPNVGAPTFKQGTGPIVLIDGGHHNFHTMDGRYLPFARILQRDGYIVRSHDARFTRSDLDRSKILQYRTRWRRRMRMTGIFRRPRHSIPLRLQQYKAG
jgi:hypothetical protein